MQPTEAYIYCRVSSKKQVDEGSGIESQETICRLFCQRNNIQVLEVIKEPGISGSDHNRPAFAKMMDQLMDLSQKGKKVLVVFDDINRLARHDVYSPMFRNQIEQLGHSLKFLNFNYEQNSAGKFMFNVLSAVAAFGSDENRERVLKRMEARLRDGYWPFRCPLGYDMKSKQAPHRVEPIASILASNMKKLAQ